CSHCGTTTTPLWRRAPNGDTICNACGLYLKTKHTMRPLTDEPAVKKNSCGTTKKQGSCGGLVCANCRTTTTPLWRRDDQGNTICNACGLYYKLHKVHRPVSMKRNVIKRRKRM
ncbi:iron transporter biosynthesis regulating transcription factor, partial [Chlamydoabsidia padenii]